MTTSNGLIKKRGLKKMSPTATTRNTLSEGIDEKNKNAQSVHNAIMSNFRIPKSNVVRKNLAKISARVIKK